MKNSIVILLLLSSVTCFAQSITIPAGVPVTLKNTPDIQWKSDGNKKTPNVSAVVNSASISGVNKDVQSKLDVITNNIYGKANKVEIDSLQTIVAALANRVNKLVEMVTASQLINGNQKKYTDSLIDQNAHFAMLLYSRNVLREDSISAALRAKEDTGQICYLSTKFRELGKDSLHPLNIEIVPTALTEAERLATSADQAARIVVQWDGAEPGLYMMTPDKGWVLLFSLVVNQGL